MYNKLLLQKIRQPQPTMQQLSFSDKYVNDEFSDDRTCYVTVIDLVKYGKMMTTSPLEYFDSTRYELDQIDSINSDYYELKQIFNQIEKGVSSVGYQRNVSTTRIKEIVDYVCNVNNYSDHIIPNSLLLSIEADEFDISSEDEIDTLLQSSNGVIFVRNLITRDDFLVFDSSKIDLLKNRIFIIDGNHRVQGIMEAIESQKWGYFEIAATLIINQTHAYQADIFETVNDKATAVNSSYMYQILGQFKIGRKLDIYLHNLVELLNTTSGSPLFKRIKMTGFSNKDSRKQTISQSFLITQFDKSLFGKRKVKQLKKDEYLLRVPVLRSIYIKNQDYSAYIIYNYFNQFKNCFNDYYSTTIGDNAWDQLVDSKEAYSFKSNYMLKTLGLGVLIELLPAIFITELYKVDSSGAIFDVVNDEGKCQDIKIDFNSTFNKILREYKIMDVIEKSYQGGLSQGFLSKLAKDCAKYLYENSNLFTEATDKYLRWYSNFEIDDIG